MMELVENRRAAGWEVRIGNDLDDRIALSHLWYCTFASEDDVQGARADTPTLAAARAALLTTLENEP